MVLAGPPQAFDSRRSLTYKSETVNTIGLCRIDSGPIAFATELLVHRGAHTQTFSTLKEFHDAAYR